MDVRTKSVERLIGWLTFAIGASSLQHNESIVYRVMSSTAPIPAWILLWCGLGLVMVSLTYLGNAERHVRARVIMVAILLLLWLAVLTIVGVTGPFGPIGGYGIVICFYLIGLIYAYIKKSSNGKR